MATLAAMLAAAVFAYHSRGVDPLAAIPPAVHMGTIAQGYKPTFDVLVSNSWGRDVAIDDVAASCGCTTASKIRVIPAHGRAAIRITFNSGGKVGLQRKVVTLTPSDHSINPLTIPIDGAVARQIEVSPGTMDAGTLAPNASAHAGATISGVEASRISLAVASCPAHVRALLKRSSPSAYSLVAIVRADGRSGDFEDVVVLHCLGKVRYDLDVPVRYSVRGLYGVDPPQINLGSVAPGTVAMSSVRIRGPNMDRLSVKSTPDGVISTLRHLSGEAATLSVQFKPKGGSKRVVLAGAVAVATHAAAQPELSVPLYAAVVAGTNVH